MKPNTTNTANFNGNAPLLAIDAGADTPPPEDMGGYLPRPPRSAEAVSIYRQTLQQMRKHYQESLREDELTPEQYKATRQQSEVLAFLLRHINTSPFEVLEFFGNEAAEKAYFMMLNLTFLHDVCFPEPTAPKK